MHLLPSRIKIKLVKVQRFTCLEITDEVSKAHTPEIYGKFCNHCIQL